MKKKILFVQNIHRTGMDRLREHYAVTVAENEKKEVLLSAVRDADAIVTRLTEIDRDVIDAAQNLKAIAKNGIGVDNIDVAYATSKGIPVLTTGFANTWSVAEHTVFAMGALFKRIVYFDQKMHSGNWSCRDSGGIQDVTGRVFGIIGFGRIGRYVAGIIKDGFHMDVLVYDPYLDRAGVEALGCRWTDSLEDLCRTADVISLHMPLTQENTHIINDRTLALMKPSAIVINFSRGLMVDEDALYRALAEKRIAGAALDAFVPEPPVFTHPLYRLDNVLLSPHTAGISEDARERMSLKVAEGLEAVLEGQVPELCANKKELYGD